MIAGSKGTAIAGTRPRSQGECRVSESVDFNTVFGRLRGEQAREESTRIGGVDVRMVHVAAGSSGQWDRHDSSTETVVVWSGDFTVEFREHTLRLSAGQCCVVPVGAEHRGSSERGAEIVLFQQAR